MVRACTDYQEELSALLDNELDESTNTDVTNHLTECSDCASRFETIKSLSSLLIKECTNIIEIPDLWDKLKDDLPSLCSVIDEDLSAYLDGELPSAAQEGVKHHLDDCKPCLEKFKQLNATNQALSKGLSLPDGIEIDIWSAIKNKLDTDCDGVRDDLSAYADQEVDSTRHRFITSHLIECVPCRQSYEKVTAVGDLLKEHYKPQIPENLNLWPGIKVKMQVVPFTPRQSKSKKKVRPRFAVMVGAAAAVVGLLGSLALWLSLPDDFQFPTVSPEQYLIESSFQEPTDSAEAVVYE
ncbi:MAG: zf-HC2 domain-containing protein [Candidatus Obscuribacterales bacterium]|nr:zf-HC2 domain-containing protein [Candidatus Obscuribacterales bacterium]